MRIGVPRPPRSPVALPTLVGAGALGGGGVVVRYGFPTRPRLYVEYLGAGTAAGGGMSDDDVEMNT